MAAVYKSLSKPDKKDEHKGAGGKKNKQRVLILSSRGVTHRYAENISSILLFLLLQNTSAMDVSEAKLTRRFYQGIGIS
jgi:ribosome biogenesis protein BRX1